MPDSAPPILIRKLQASDSINELTLLLNRSYKVLADMGLKYVATYQDNKVTKNRIKGGICLVAMDNNTIIGTITMHAPPKHSVCEFFKRSDVAHLSQLGVEPDYREQGIGKALMSEAEKLAGIKGCKYLALDTAEPARHLIEWYTRIGFEFVEFVDWDVTNYRSVVMKKKIKK